jgi:hypothetical protein
MIISTYNPENAQATCPKCGFVKCRIVRGNLAFGRRYMVFYHEACKTEWEITL